MGNKSPEKDKEAELRRAVFEAAENYFKSVKKPKPFIAGQTYIPVTAKSLDATDLCALMDASLDLWLTAGRFSNEFEEKISQRLQRKSKALLVNSGSSANLLALSSLGNPMLENFNLKPLSPGDEVITLAAGFPTTVNPIFQNGWTPVFIDIDLDTLNALPEVVKSAKTNKTRAVILAHTLGNPFLADEISNWCEKENIFFIEDCCDALGSTINGKPAGSFGDYSTLSFYPAHHITMGEGGAVLPKNGKLRRAAESMRDWGRDCWCEPGKDNTCKKRFEWQLGDLPNGYDHKYIYSSIGYNLKATDLQAAIGLTQLSKLNQFILSRRDNWKSLAKGIQSSPILSKCFKPVKPTPGTEPSWFGFAIVCANGIDRNHIVRELEKNAIGTRLLFGGNLTKQPAYKSKSFKTTSSLANTDIVMNQVFWIGVHPLIEQPQIEYMLSTLEKIAKSV